MSRGKPILSQNFKLPVVQLTIMTAFVDWLATELDQRGWSMSELGRRAGQSHSLISEVLAQKRDPTPDFVLNVARALNERPEHLLRLAGHLPAAPPETDLDTQVCAVFRAIPDDDLRNAVARVLFGLVGKAAEHAPTVLPSRSGQAAPTNPPSVLEERMQQHVLALCDVLLPLIDEQTHAYLMDQLNVLREERKRERERPDQERCPDPESRTDRST